MGMGEIRTAMDYSTRNSHKAKKVKDEAAVEANTASTMSTLPNNNDNINAATAGAMKPTQSHYDLRNGKTFIIHPASKSAEEHNNSIKCPPLARKTKEHFFHMKGENNNHFRGTGAKAVGNKGHLSPKYNKSIRTKYITQLFCEKNKIGEGSFGSVHKYYSYEDQKCYAIKLIPKRYKNTEIKNLDAMDGLPYCIQYYNAWEEDNLVYIQLELGVMSLADYAQKNHNISEEECWNILHDITNAMMCLHDHELIHMDIKPENIIITPEGKYKLCDFGLLYRMNQKKNPPRTCEGDAKYIASEILQGIVTPAGDVFSLGISVLEIAMDLLLPIHGELWHDIRNCDWRTLPKGEKRRISIELEQLLNWMMSSQADQRPSALQLLGSPAIRMRSRSKKTRFNYFNDWYQKYLGQRESEVVPKIVVNHDNTVECSSVYDLNVENDNIKTPPRRISSILICQRVK